MKDRFLDLLKFVLIGIVFRLFHWTWRTREDELPPSIRERLDRGLPVVFAHFHEDEWPLLSIYADRGMSVLVSHSRDGGVMSRFLRSLGYNVVRGSSSRGGAVGLLSLIRGVQQSPRPMASLAVDGPRGPRREVKSGIFKLAERLEAPIVPGATGASRAYVFKKSWSRALLPLPFARVRLVYSAPIEWAAIARASETNELGALAVEVRRRVEASREEAMKSVGGDAYV